MVGWQGNIVLILLVIGMVTPTIWLQTSCLALPSKNLVIFMAHLESEKDSLGSWNSKFVVKKNFSQPFPNSRELWKESFLNSTLFILLFIVFVDATNKEIFY